MRSARFHKGGGTEVTFSEPDRPSKSGSPVLIEIRKFDYTASTTGDGMSNCTGAHVHMTKGQSSPVYKARVVA